MTAMLRDADVERPGRFPVQVGRIRDVAVELDMESLGQAPVGVEHLDPCGPAVGHVGRARPIDDDVAGPRKLLAPVRVDPTPAAVEHLHAPVPGVNDVPSSSMIDCHCPWRVQLVSPFDTELAKGVQEPSPRRVDLHSMTRSINEDHVPHVIDRTVNGMPDLIAATEHPEHLARARLEDNYAAIPLIHDVEVVVDG